MEIELPVLRILEQRNPNVRAVLGEVLNHTYNLLGESHVKVGDRTGSDLVPWVDKTIHDGHTVLDYVSFLSKMIDLDVSYVDNNFKSVKI
jgi:hypothetical protein